MNPDPNDPTQEMIAQADAQILKWTKVREALLSVAGSMQPVTGRIAPHGYLLKSIKEVLKEGPMSNGEIRAALAAKKYPYVVTAERVRMECANSPEIKSTGKLKLTRYQLK